MMGVVESKWVIRTMDADFVWQILADLFFFCWSLVEMSYTHHLLLHKVGMI
jgi:hypothetical protein